jgi:hypothetical protein
VLDTSGLIAAVVSVTGRRLLGVIDCEGCIELVLADTRPNERNLVSIPTSGSSVGRVLFGAVADPEGYASRSGRPR